MQSNAVQCNAIHGVSHVTYLYRSVSTLTSRLRDIESQLRVGAEEFQQQVQATLLTAEDLAEVIFGVNCSRLHICLLTAALQVRIRYIEEIEQPLREEIGDLRQRLGQEQVQ